jgi:hypothetical protein
MTPKSLKRQPLKVRKSGGLKQSSKLKPKTPLSKAKPKGVAKLKKEADKWFSLAVRYGSAEFENGEWVVKCVTCPNRKSVKTMQCGHFMSRRHNATRFSEENTAPQCYGCNVMHQGQQFQFGIEIDRMYGVGTASRLAKESKQEYRFTVEKLQQIIDDSRVKLDFYLKTGV